MSAKHSKDIVITGGEPAPKPKLQPMEAIFIAELYGKLRAIDAGKLRCSAQTFTNHLEHNTLIAGPWDWCIDNKVRYGEIVCYARNGDRLGSVTVSDLALH